MYVIVLANKDGKLGPQLHPSTIDCPEPKPDQAPAPPDPVRWCGFRGVGSGSVFAQGVTLVQMATIFSAYGEVRRPVFDRTGLTGKFDLHIESTPALFRGKRRFFSSAHPTGRLWSERVHRHAGTTRPEAGIDQRPRRSPRDRPRRKADAGLGSSQHQQTMTFPWYRDYEGLTDDDLKRLVVVRESSETFDRERLIAKLHARDTRRQVLLSAAILLIAGLIRWWLFPHRGA